ncbi:alpha/beta hydrolase [Streptomyces sp. N2-109]|uniref:Alpha/beta hydrolase n=1 Tax=Streptomyces gossypii TaxID=2883101 RepID=A0ABT2JNZ8_9ACTN|nr:alpha/beta hydrolase [Streptomyces gossypii]MCT2589595.1 alpha/beta hydrolase [Streptomyces gossypii]
MTDGPWVNVAAADGLQVWRGPGSGPPMVALHGLEDTWANWGPLTARLPGFTPYALQLPWHSGTDYGWRAQGTPAQWLSRALALVPEQPAVILAHSFGATVLLSHLAPGPGPGLSAVVLVAPVYRPAELTLTDELRDRSRSEYREVLRLGLGKALGAKAARMDPEIRGLMEQKVLDRAVPAGFPVFYEQFGESGLQDLTGFDVPTLVLAGTRDAGLTPERAAALKRAMPVAQVTLRPEYGHFCHLEQVADVSRDVDAFLSSSSATHRIDHHEARNPA